jgi:polyisoprenoid-binding protein YceI
MDVAPAAVAIPGYLAGTWTADPSHSEIAFTARHLMISKVRGRFTGYDVTIVTGEDLLSSTVDTTI